MGKIRCGEKTPQHLRHAPEILQEFPDAKVICMMRDGYEVALSLNSMPWWPPRNLADAANLWKSQLQLMETYIRRYPSQFMVMRYEYLVDYPKEVLSSIMLFLGEKLEQRQFQYDIQSRVVLPRSMDWKGQSLLAIDAANVGKRRKSISAEVSVFLKQALSGELLRYGYDA